MSRLKHILKPFLNTTFSLNVAAEPAFEESKEMGAKRRKILRL